MATASGQFGQRKRKMDLVSECNRKRKRLSDTLDRATEDYPLSSSLSQDQVSRSVTRPNAFIETGIPRAGSASSNTDDRLDDLDSEEDLSDSELSTDAETTSDSGTSSSESDEKDLEEEGSEEDPVVDDPGNGQHLLRSETDTISLPAPTKPAPSSSSELRSRIADFLPQLRKANEDLANAGDGRRIDAVADGQDHYIEMDLGLGVLRERSRPKLPAGEIQIHDRSSSTSSSSSGSSDGESETERSGMDLMRDLLGRKEKRGGQGRPVIQPLDET